MAPETNGLAKMGIKEEGGSLSSETFCPAIGRANNRFHRTAIPLRFRAAGELGRGLAQTLGSAIRERREPHRPGAASSFNRGLAEVSWRGPGRLEGQGWGRIWIVPLKDVNSTRARPVLRTPTRLLADNMGEANSRLDVIEKALSSLPRTVLARSSKEALVGQATFMSPL